MKREANKVRGGTVKQSAEKRITSKGKNIAADIQTPGESFTPDEIQTVDESIARIAKAHGKTVDEIKLEAAEVFGKINAAEVERLRTTVREAAADMQAMSQEVVTAQMWRRWEKRKREQERNAFAKTIVQIQQPPDRWYSTDEVLRAYDLPQGALSHKARLAKLGLEQKPKATKQTPSLYRRIDGQPIRDKKGRAI